jgi:hypothetical protein
VISLSAGFTDAEDPTPVGFVVLSPITPAITGLYFSTLEASITLTDAGTNGVTASSSSLPQLFQATVEGVGVIDLGGSLITGPGTFSFMSSTIKNASDFGGSIDSFGISISFEGSGGEDSYSLTATHTLEALVSAPSALMLLGLGLTGIGIQQRKENKAA